MAPQDVPLCQKRNRPSYRAGQSKPKVPMSTPRCTATRKVRTIVGGCIAKPIASGVIEYRVGVWERARAGSRAGSREHVPGFFGEGPQVKSRSERMDPKGNHGSHFGGNAAMSASTEEEQNTSQVSFRRIGRLRTRHQESRGRNGGHNKMIRRGTLPTPHQKKKNSSISFAILS